MELVVRQDSISDPAALAVVAAAVKHGHAIGCRVNAAVVDVGGNLVAFLRAPGAFLHSITIAQDKAYTAASFGIPTADFFGLIKDAPPLREGIVHRDRLVIFGGGLPIMHAGRVIGGVGVSGGSEEQDCLCAKAGLAALALDEPAARRPSTDEKR